MYLRGLSAKLAVQHTPRSDGPLTCEPSVVHTEEYRGATASRPELVAAPLDGFYGSIALE